jgi:hypothetical protein
MTKSLSITATAQGIVAFDVHGKARMERYEDSFAKIANRSEITKKTPAVLDTMQLNMPQRQMYRRLMYGMKNYDDHERSGMSNRAIARVEKDSLTASRAMHVLKAKRFYDLETKLCKAIFPHARIGENDRDWFLELPKTATLKKLGIGTREIIDDFIKRKLLPENFYSINADNIQLL